MLRYVILQQYRASNKEASHCWMIQEKPRLTTFPEAKRTKSSSPSDDEKCQLTTYNRPRPIFAASTESEAQEMFRGALREGRCRIFVQSFAPQNKPLQIPCRYSYSYCFWKQGGQQTRPTKLKKMAPYVCSHTWYVGNILIVCFS